MAYNILNGGENRLDLIVKVIKKENPDFLVINEANGFDKDDKINNFSREIRLPYYKLSFKRKAMEKFNESLKESDAILVMNYTKDGKENHIGANTLMEIGMAFILQKKIFVLNPSPEFCKDELEAIEVPFLNGDLSKISD